MKIFELRNESGAMFAFEVSSSLLGRRGACRVVRSIPAVRVIRETDGQVGESEDEFCEFELEGIRFKVWEPWGDSSRYWIGPSVPGVHAQLDAIRHAFARSTLLHRLLRAAG